MSFEYINAQDNITPRYNEATFNTDLNGNSIIVVRTDNEQGYYDMEGKYISFPKKCYNKNFFEGITDFFENGKFGFMDITGTVIIEPQYDNVGQFSEGLASVRADWNEGSGYIDTTGQYVIEPIYLAAGRFSENVAPVKVKIQGKEKWGYINKKGDFVIEPKYSSAHSFINGKALVTFDRKTVYIDLMGNVLGSVGDPYIDFYDGLRKCTSNRRYGYINEDGKIIITPQFTAATRFSEGLAGVKKRDEKYGFIDTTGNYVIPPKFENVGCFSQGLCNIKIGKKYGYINKSGNIVIKPTLEEAMHFDDNGLAIDRKDGKLGLIDNKGVWVVSPEFNRIWPYKKICLVRIGLKFDVIRIIK